MREEFYGPGCSSPGFYVEDEIESNGVNVLRFDCGDTGFEKLDLPEVLRLRNVIDKWLMNKKETEKPTKLCAFCEGKSVLTKVKQVYICTKCGATVIMLDEGETLVQKDEEAPK